MRYLPQQLDNQPVPSPLPHISLHSFMEQTVVYEDMPVAFDRRLSQATWLGIALTLVGLLTTLLVPLQELARGASLLVLAEQLRGYMTYITGSLWIQSVDIVSVVAVLILLVQTRNLQQGKILYHWLAFVEALVGAANLIVLAIPLLMVVLNLALVIVLAIVGILIGVVVVGSISYALYQLIRFLITLVYWLAVITLLTSSIVAVIFVALMLLRAVLVH